MANTRRGLLTLVLAGGLLLIAAGFVRSAGTITDSGGSYTEVTLGVPIRVNPLSQPTVDSERDLAGLVFGGLMRLRPDGTPEPELAERWEVTPDGLTYTFHLHEDVTWQDGSAFDASDVAFTIGLIQAEGFTGAASIRAEWEGVQAFVADAWTILIRLPEPSADFLTRATVGILPEHLATEMDMSGGFAASPFDRKPVGTGPYRLVSLNNSRAILEHNTSYVLGAPSIARLELRFADSLDDLEETVRDGGMDGALLGEDAGTRVTEIAEDAGLAITPLPSDSYTILYINNARDPLDSPNLRRALAASINVGAVLAASGIDAAAGVGVIVAGSWGYQETESLGIPLDVVWAQTQWDLGSSGLRERNGEPLVLELVTNGESARIAMAEAIADQLEAQGVTVEIVALPAQRVVSEYLRPGSYDLGLFGWEATPDPDPYAGWHTSQIGAGNVAGFSDPEADALLEVARTTLDVAERIELYGLFLARFEQLGASRVIAYPRRAYLHPEGLEGFTPRLLVNSSSRFDDIHLWRLD